MKFCSMFEANYCLLPNGPMCGRVFGFTPTNPGIQRILRDQHHGCNRDQHAVPGVSPCLCLVTLKTGIGLGICHQLALLSRHRPEQMSVACSVESGLASAVCVSLVSVQAAKITPTPFPEWETFLETVNYVRITACAKMVANGMSSMRGVCILAHSSTQGCAKFCAEIFAGIFTVECVLKIFALRTNYWGSALRVKTICAKGACKFACSGDRWNCFDFTCVATDLVSLFACVKLPQVSPPPPRLHYQPPVQVATIVGIVVSRASNVDVSLVCGTEQSQRSSVAEIFKHFGTCRAIWLSVFPEEWENSDKTRAGKT